MNNIKKYFLLFGIVSVMVLQSCQQPDGNSTGSEFMPEMAHSVAYEANYYNYYYNNTWGSQDEYYELAKPRLPVKGTIPRGYAGVAFAQNEDEAMAAMATTKGLTSSVGISFSPNGSVPYYYEDTEEERTRAMTEIIDNPYPITEAGLAEGKELYDIFCGICHGDAGDGNGYIVREDGGKYPVQPANFLLDEFVTASNGRYYHSIIYGKNLMGGYTAKLSYEERWQVIHYIRSLQAKDKKLAYNQLENTLNSIDKPAGETVVSLDDVYGKKAEKHDDSQGSEHSTDAHHGDGHDDTDTH